MAGFFRDLYEPPAGAGFFGIPVSSAYQQLLLSNPGVFRRSTEPYWRGIPIIPGVDPNMPIFGPSPNLMFGTPVIKELPPPPVPPYIGSDGKLHLDDVNPKFKQKVMPGPET
jgi:hypothetical protein